MRVGVLALQGAVREHALAISKLGHEALAVRNVRELDLAEALILPGGESTAMRKLLDQSTLLPALEQYCQTHRVLGTCAGAILLAKKVICGQSHIKALDVTMERNAYGSQLESFVREGQIKGIGNFNMVFIRAPKFIDMAKGIEAIAWHEGRVVGVRQRNIWAVAFHPELSSDLRLHQLFLEE